MKEHSSQLTAGLQSKDWDALNCNPAFLAIKMYMEREIIRMLAQPIADRDTMANRMVAISTIKDLAMKIDSYERVTRDRDGKEERNASKEGH